MNFSGNFALSGDQQMVRDAAESFLTERSTSAAVRQAMESVTGFDPTLWRAIGRDLGWTATHIPEAYGGLGLSWVELTLILEQMGRRLLCSPFFGTVVVAATTLIEAAGDEAKDRYLPQIASGDCPAAVAFGERGVQWSPSGVTAKATRTDHGYRLDGKFLHVLDGNSASLFFVVARIDDEIALFAIPRESEGVSIMEHETIDRTRRVAQLVFSHVPLNHASMLARGSALDVALERVEALSAIGLAAEQLGGAQQCLDLTLSYAAQRVQFGRSINSFQAVKHRCAEMMVKIEATRSALYGAARSATPATTTRDLVLEAATLKAFASDAFYFCAAEAIQLHGGVGFTWEYDPHLYFKRAQAGTHWFGSPDQWRAKVAAQLLAAA